MIKQSIIIIIVSFGLTAIGQDSTLNDGPYLFIENSKIIQKNVVDGKVVSQELQDFDYDTIFNTEHPIIKNVDTIATLSDIHGQFDLAVEILQNNQIIDQGLNWKFGKGHLVIAGDIFDRGSQVTETLWLIYNLENRQTMLVEEYIFF